MGFLREKPDLSRIYDLKMLNAVLTEKGIVIPFPRRQVRGPDFFSAQSSGVSQDTETPAPLCFLSASRAEGAAQMHMRPVPDLDWPVDLFVDASSELDEVGSAQGGPFGDARFGFERNGQRADDPLVCA